MTIILAPIVTEKTVEEMKKGKYAFKISKNADKNSVKKFVEREFKVNVLDIATSNIKARKRRTMQGKTVRQPSFKKAVVKIKDGQKIDVFNTGGDKT